MNAGAIFRQNLCVVPKPGVRGSIPFRDAILKTCESPRRENRCGPRVMGRPRRLPGYQQISVGEDARPDATNAAELRYHVSRLRRPTCLLPTTSRRTPPVTTPQAILSGIFEMTASFPTPSSWRQLEAYLSLRGITDRAMVVGKKVWTAYEFAGSGSRDVVLAPSPVPGPDQRSGCTAPRQPERWGLRAPSDCPASCAPDDELSGDVPAASPRCRQKCRGVRQRRPAPRSDCRGWS